MIKIGGTTKATKNFCVKTTRPSVTKKISIIIQSQSVKISDTILLIQSSYQPTTTNLGSNREHLNSLIKIISETTIMETIRNDITEISIILKRITISSHAITITTTTFIITQIAKLIIIRNVVNTIKLEMGRNKSFKANKNGSTVTIINKITTSTILEGIKSLKNASKKSKRSLAFCRKMMNGENL